MAKKQFEQNNKNLAIAYYGYSPCVEYSGAGKPPVRQFGNRRSGV